MKDLKKIRPSWDDYFMALVKIISTRSTCDRLHAGAVLVKNNRIIASGYNGSPPGLPHCNDEGHLMEEGHCVRTIHAEHNVLLQTALIPGGSTEGSTLYTNYTPCIHCAKYIVACRIKRVVVGKVYRNAKTLDYLKEAGLAVEIYKENPKWNERVMELFKGEIPDVEAEEGRVKMEIKK